MCEVYAGKTYKNENHVTTTTRQPKNLAHETTIQKTWLVGLYIGDEKLPSYLGIIIRNLYKDQDPY